jgi:hypothetical protein
MELTVQQKLECPFPASAVHWRVGNTNAKKLGVKPWEATEGSALAYIDARDVMERLDKAVGMENWQCDYPLSESGLLICRIGIRASVFNPDLPHDEWIWKANGAGDTQVEKEKGKASDAFKRAAVLFGIGQYLYKIPFQWGKLRNGNIDFTPVLPPDCTVKGYMEKLKGESK